MTKENLLKPRWKVIADYPESIYTVGEVEQPEYYIERNIAFFNKYPHLFRNLSWWEDRDVLPDYVKSKLGIFKVNWTVRNDELYLTDATDENDTWIKIHEGIDPSDIQEYNDYLATKK